jgi:hypothetical protein
MCSIQESHTATACVAHSVEGGGVMQRIAPVIFSASTLSLQICYKGTTKPACCSLFVVCLESVCSPFVVKLFDDYQIMLEEGSFL